MYFRRPSSRWALWAFAAALLLKSVMPWLASASAEMRGKTLVEVCSVYGFSLVPIGDGRGQPETESAPAPAPAPAPEHMAAHGGEHCALTALVVLGGSEPPALAAVVPAQRHNAALFAQPGSLAHDACAAWVARRKHGPPALA